MRKLLLSGVFAVSLMAGEFDFGKGTLKIQGGFLGLDSEKSANVVSYSLSEQHKNIFSTNWFYKYNITWFQSKDVVNAQQSVNVNLNGSQTNLILPMTDYKYEGLDANFVLGKDIYKQKDSHLGIGLLLGLSLPWIESKKDSDNNDDTSSYILNAMKKSKTEIKTFKIGLNVNVNKDFNRFFALYASGSYAYQTGNVKNDYANVDSNSEGNFKAFEAGLRFTPFSYKKKIGMITLTPKLYFTLGYRHSYWKLKDIAIDITGNNILFGKNSLEIKTSIGYVGVGYSF